MPVKLTRAYLQKVVRGSGWDLSEVESLNLEEEAISHLGNSFSGMSSLVYLSLARNDLSSLQGIEHLCCLRTAILSDNRVRGMGEVLRLAQLPDLRALDLRLNPIMKSPASGGDGFRKGSVFTDGGNWRGGNSAVVTPAAGTDTLRDGESNRTRRGRAGYEGAHGYARGPNECCNDATSITSSPRDNVLAILPRLLSLNGREVAEHERQCQPQRPQQEFPLAQRERRQHQQQTPPTVLSLAGGSGGERRSPAIQSSLGHAISSAADETIDRSAKSFSGQERTVEKNGQEWKNRSIGNLRPAWSLPSHSDGTHTKQNLRYRNISSTASASNEFALQPPIATRKRDRIGTGIASAVGSAIRNDTAAAPSEGRHNLAREVLSGQAQTAKARNANLLRSRRPSTGGGNSPRAHRHGQKEAGLLPEVEHSTVVASSLVVDDDTDLAALWTELGTESRSRGQSSLAFRAISPTVRPANTTSRKLREHYPYARKSAGLDAHVDVARQKQDTAVSSSAQSITSPPSPPSSSSSSTQIVPGRRARQGLPELSMTALEASVKSSVTTAPSSRQDGRDPLAQGVHECETPAREEELWHHKICNERAAGVGRPRDIEGSSSATTQSTNDERRRTRTQSSQSLTTQPDAGNDMACAGLAGHCGSGHVRRDDRSGKESDGDVSLTRVLCSSVSRTCSGATTTADDVTAANVITRAADASAVGDEIASSFSLKPRSPLSSTPTDTTAVASSVNASVTIAVAAVDTHPCGVPTTSASRAVEAFRRSALRLGLSATGETTGASSSSAASERLRMPSSRAKTGGDGGLAAITPSDQPATAVEGVIAAKMPARASPAATATTAITATSTVSPIVAASLATTSTGEEVERNTKTDPAVSTVNSSLRPSVSADSALSTSMERMKAPHTTAIDSRPAGRAATNETRAARERSRVLLVPLAPATVAKNAATVVGTHASVVSIPGSQNAARCSVCPQCGHDSNDFGEEDRPGNPSESSTVKESASTVAAAEAAATAAAVGRKIEGRWWAREREFERRWAERERAFDARWATREREFDKIRRHQSKVFTKTMRCMLFEAHDALKKSKDCMVKRLETAETQTTQVTARCSGINVSASTAAIGPSFLVESIDAGAALAIHSDGNGVAGVAKHRETPEGMALSNTKGCPSRGAIHAELGAAAAAKTAACAVADSVPNETLMSSIRSGWGKHRQEGGRRERHLPHRHLSSGARGMLSPPAALDGGGDIYDCSGSAIFVAEEERATASVALGAEISDPDDRDVVEKGVEDRAASARCHARRIYVVDQAVAAGEEAGGGRGGGIAGCAGVSEGDDCVFVSVEATGSLPRVVTEESCLGNSTLEKQVAARKFDEAQKEVNSVTVNEVQIEEERKSNIQRETTFRASRVTDMYIMSTSADVDEGENNSGVERKGHGKQFSEGGGEERLTGMLHARNNEWGEQGVGKRGTDGFPFALRRFDDVPGVGVGDNNLSGDGSHVCFVSDVDGDVVGLSSSLKETRPTSRARSTRDPSSAAGPPFKKRGDRDGHERDDDSEIEKSWEGTDDRAVATVGVAGNAVPCLDPEVTISEPQQQPC